jgi:hypothetical protein
MTVTHNCEMCTARRMGEARPPNCGPFSLSKLTEHYHFVFYLLCQTMSYPLNSEDYRTARWKGNQRFCKQRTRS